MCVHVQDLGCAAGIPCSRIHQCTGRQTAGAVDLLLHTSEKTLLGTKPVTDGDGDGDVVDIAHAV